MTIEGSRRSALGELEAASRLAAAILLALDHAAVAGEEAAGLEHLAQRRLEEGQRAADAVAHGARLPRQPAAGHGAGDVVLVDPAGRAKGLIDQHAQHRPREVDGTLAAIDRDPARAGLDPHAGNGILALARGIGAALAVELRL